MCQIASLFELCSYLNSLTKKTPSNDTEKTLTQENRCIHVDEKSHGQDARGEHRMKDLTDGVVKHVSRIETHVRDLDLGGIIAHIGLGLHEFGNI